MCLFEKREKKREKYARFKVYNYIYIYIYTVYGDMKYILWHSILDSIKIYEQQWLYVSGNLFTKHMRLINKFCSLRWFIK